MSHRQILERLRRELTPELYRQIREQWKAHSIAEDKRDIPGLLSTLTEDCVYEVISTGDRWTGHQGAARFYEQLLTAFPDIKFELTDIVIGPQGVCEEALVTGVHHKDWLRFKASRQPIAFKVVIFFSWDLQQGKFQGEKIYFDAKLGLRSGVVESND